MNSRTRRRPARGDISLRKERPIWADANGTRPLLKSRRRLKLRKWPCAVSGRRKLRPVVNVEEDGWRVGLDLPWMLACWADAAGEHEIELLRLANLIVGIRVTNIVFSAEVA